MSMDRDGASESGRRQTPRARFRAQMRDEIKELALRQLAEAGPQGISLNAIAREIGVSGPALYRYFASRDELLTELVIDAYDDLAAALKDAAEAASDRRAGDRLRAVARAYRAWAVAAPHRYRLLFGPPLPGYDAHTDRLVTASRASMGILLIAQPQHPLKGIEQSGRRLMRQIKANSVGGWEIDPALFMRALITWSRLHGLISLEIGGNFASMGLDPEQVYEIELAGLL
jgi:AcrR family transcriptional regulator